MIELYIGKWCAKLLLGIFSALAIAFIGVILLDIVEEKRNDDE